MSRRAHRRGACSGCPPRPFWLVWPGHDSSDRHDHHRHGACRGPRMLNTHRHCCRDTRNAGSHVWLSNVVARPQLFAKCRACRRRAYHFYSDNRNSNKKQTGTKTVILYCWHRLRHRFHDRLTPPTTAPRDQNKYVP